MRDQTDRGFNLESGRLQRIISVLGWAPWLVIIWPGTESQGKLGPTSRTTQSVVRTENTGAGGDSEENGRSCSSCISDQWSPPSPRCLHHRPGVPAEVPRFRRSQGAPVSTAPLPGAGHLPPSSTHCLWSRDRVAEAMCGGVDISRYSVEV